MRKILLIITAAAALVSCRKPDSVIPEQTPEKPEQPAAVTSFTAIVTDYDYGETKAAVTEDDARGKAAVSWESGDRISINGQVFTSDTSGSAVTFTNPSADVISLYKAIYPASLDTGTEEYTLHAVQAHNEEKAYYFPMYACSDNTILTFRNICAVLAITVPEGLTATRVEVSSGKAMNGRFTVEDYAAVMTKTDGLTDDEKKVTVYGSFASGAVVYVAVPPAAYTDLTVKLITESETITHTKALNAAANHIYHIKMPPAGALRGLFTVQDPDGKPSSGDEVQVRFSKGNLYYDGSAFQFEANQYDYRHYNGKTGDAAVIGGISKPTPAGHVGSFFWSRTASVAMASAYSDDSAAVNDIFFTNADPTTPKADFTANGAAGVWRTLSGGSSGECNYLLFIRKVLVGGERKLPYGQGIVAGVRGLILLPDDWNGSVCPNFRYGASDYVNSFTSATTPAWSDMETAGAVFLPAAGVRVNNYIDNNLNNHGFYGLYWPSTPISLYTAGDMSFYSNCVYIYDGFNTNRSSGYSVRLVYTNQ